MWGSLALRLVLAVSLPFSDGFEAPETNFSSWTVQRLVGSNQLWQSSQQAFSGSQSLEFTYAGNKMLDEAAAVIDFDAPVTTPSVRFWLYVPAGTEASMATSTYIRLVRMLEGTTADGGIGSQARLRLNLWRSGASPNRLYVQVAYEDSGGSVGNYGTQSTTRITEGVWHFIEFSYEPTLPRVRLFVDDPLVPKFDAAPTDTAIYALSTCWVGLAKSADDQSTAVSIFIDDVTVSGTRLPLLMLDGGSDAGAIDAGRPDGGFGDAGSPDAGASDAGANDAGVSDAGTSDAGTSDAGMSDAGMSDAGMSDAGGGDAGTTDAGLGDAGPSDAGTPDAGVVDAGTDAGPAADGGFAGADGGDPRPDAVIDLGCGCGTGDAAFAVLALGALSRRRSRRLR